MRNQIYRALWLVAIFFTFSLTVLAQNRSIQGTVLTEDGEPLPGVSIVIQGTTTGVITDIDGHFQLQAAPEDMLQISFIGFDNQVITVGDQSRFNIIMQDR